MRCRFEASIFPPRRQGGVDRLLSSLTGRFFRQRVTAVRPSSLLTNFTFRFPRDFSFCLLVVFLFAVFPFVVSRSWAVLGCLFPVLPLIVRYVVIVRCLVCT